MRRMPVHTSPACSTLRVVSPRRLFPRRPKAKPLIALLENEYTLPPSGAGYHLSTPTGPQSGRLDEFRLLGYESLFFGVFGRAAYLESAARRLRRISS
mmetsp:Transcript_31226/g.43453  ORF Transcript_31226/g.43453 Transcript_31226/m.43453 type:complete len:98 (+) Transcript_31226:139-432(+)